MKRIIALLLVVVIAAGTSGCKTKKKTDDPMKKISAGDAGGRAADAVFTKSMAGFSVELFKHSIAEAENSLISPLSVIFALAMTANGAEGQTLSQMEKLLGSGIKLAELNEYLYSYAGSLPSEEKCKLLIANSIWMRSDDNRLNIEAGFLQTNADYYDVAAHISDFGPATVEEINNWVKTSTDGMIEGIIERIDKTAMLFLINAVVFDAEWEEIYNETAVHEGVFTDIRKEKQAVDFMYSEENIYLDDGKAIGFVKPYIGGYSFVALLPKENVGINKYIESLTGERFLNILKKAKSATVIASVPKFEYTYDVSMGSVLKTLGMPDAFDANKADFSRMGTSSGGPLCISEVLHKTYIAVDERGTKAGAATAVIMAEGASPQEKIKYIDLDRPFVFAIIDNATNLPVFLGTLMTV